VRPTPTIRVANGFVQLVTHILAHVQLDQPGNLYDPRYVSWAAAQHSPACRAILDQDAALLAQLWALDPRVDRIHSFCTLHDSLAGFRRTASRELDQLSPSEVSRPSVLVELRGFAAAELLHASAALLDDEVEIMLAHVRPELRRACDRVARPMTELVEVIPDLAERRTELVWALGVHGRYLGSRISVGAPADWNCCPPERQAILAAHEHFVGRSRETAYLEAEWSALCKLAEVLTALPGDHRLRYAHAVWLAELELGPILRGAAARGWIDEPTARRLERSPEQRAETFAYIHRPPTGRL